VGKVTLHSSRYLALGLGVLVLAALALRLQGLNHSLSVDEAWAAAMLTSPDFWQVAKTDVHPPLYYFLLREAQHLTTSFAGLRLFSVGWGLGLVALAIGSFRKMPAGAVAAASLVALLPGFVIFSQQLRSYSLLFLLLGIALAATVRIFSQPTDARSRLLLSLVLTAAAATHLIAAFFLIALAPLLLWPARKGALRAWVSALLPLVPPGLLALWFRFYFITQPGDLTGGWWISLEPGPIFDALREAFGWNEIQWLADATGRHAPGDGWPVFVVALAAALLALGTAWRRRQHDPLVWLLLISALIYFTTVITYSCLFEHVVMGRTLLPGLLPLMAGLPRGIGSHPVGWRRSCPLWHYGCNPGGPTRHQSRRRPARTGRRRHRALPFGRSRRAFPRHGLRFVRLSLPYRANRHAVLRPNQACRTAVESIARSPRWSGPQPQGAGGLPR